MSGALPRAQTDVHVETGGQAPPSAAIASPGRIDVLRSIGGLAPEVAGRFREPLDFQQIASGQYFVFDRRGHSVHAVDGNGQSSRRLVDIGGEDGRLIEPRAFAAAQDGTFVVADAPNGRERIQVFGAGGERRGGFTLPGRATPRITFTNLSLTGVGTMAFTGHSVLLSQPETGALFVEYTLGGTPFRSIGRLRETGHEDDRELNLALNAGIPLINPRGGFYFVFLSGHPVLQRYDANGTLMFERSMQGRELDPLLASMPRTWPRRTIGNVEVPLVMPIVRTASVDQAGRLWVAFTIPFTYVFDEDGEKIRTVQFRAAGIVAPTSLFFTSNGRLLITPGCYEFRPTP
jgi:hypothetical protein